MPGSRPETHSPHLDRVMDFLLWARSEGFAVHKIEYSDLHVELSDLKVGVSDAGKRAQATKELSTDEKFAAEFGMELPEDYPK